MDIIKNIKVPTGNILIVKGEKGKLECLSLGDYGKDVNIKADFMGIDREISKVEHTKMLPLTEKWVITISPQYGCGMNCRFCDVPKVGEGINATYHDMLNQITKSLSIHPEIRTTKRLNIHYARMGEPTFNNQVLRLTYGLHDLLEPYIDNSLIHPVLSTMLPKQNKKLTTYLEEWVYIKNNKYNGEAGLQFSINSTNDHERDYMFNGNSLSLNDISDISKKLEMPKGRKYTLNFAVADYEIDGNKLANLFDPNKFIVKLTPMHKTTMATQNDIKTIGNYTEYHPYKNAEISCKKAGFDVLVFIASEYEDLGRITCGNAILSGTLPDCFYVMVENNTKKGLPK